MRIGTGLSSGMGDILLLTAICKHISDCTVELKTGTERFSRFFDGQCKEVVIKDRPINLSNVGPGHYAKCKMRGIGLDNHCYLPKIIVKQEEIDRGKEILKDFDDPVALVANCSKKFKAQREVPKEYWESLVNDQINQGKTVLQFGFSDNFTSIRGAKPMVNLPLFDLIGVYSNIGILFTVDTGDRHLMLACGGTCWTARSNAYNRHERWIYESPRDNTLAFL